jgi:hypothetical protein
MIFLLHRKHITYVRFEVFTAVTMKNGVFWDVTPCDHVRTDVSEKHNAYFISVTRIGELGTTLAVRCVRRLLVKNVDGYIIKI